MFFMGMNEPVLLICLFQCASPPVLFLIQLLSDKRGNKKKNKTQSFGLFCTFNYVRKDVVSPIARTIAFVIEYVL